MAVRSNYLIGHIDGRKSIVEGGPRRKGGSMSVRFSQRDHGSISETVHVVGGMIGDNTVQTIVWVRASESEGWRKVADIRSPYNDGLRAHDCVLDQTED